MSNDGMFTIFRISQQGLNRQLKKLEVTSDNIANADKAAGPDGEVYKRKVVLDKTIEGNAPQSFGKQLNLELQRGDRKHLSKGKNNYSKLSSNKQEEAEIREIDEPKMVFNPSHPLA